jgi:formate dehydrogenase iron-sulfur subunit
MAPMRKVSSGGNRLTFWLEPMIEVAIPNGRVAYGPVAPSDVASLFAANFLQGAWRPLSLGFTGQIPYLKKQEWLTFARVGITDPLPLDDYLARADQLLRELEITKVPY